MPFTGSTFTHLFDWEKDPQRQEKIVNARLEAELDGIETALTALAWGGATAGQIAFPATQNPSGNANTLDDYEEGTWTPAYSATTPGNLSVSYFERAGSYTKIGNRVLFDWVAGTSSFTHTTASGNFLVTGFPFPASSFGICPVSWSGFNLTNGYTDILGNIGQGGAQQMAFYESGDNVGRTVVQISEVPSGGTVNCRAGGNYRV
jgi:hypothetical protein